MLEQVVSRELQDDWEYVGGSSEGDDIGATVDNKPVGSHESGAELFVDQAGFGHHADWVAHVTQPVECDGLRAEPVTATEPFTSKQQLAGFIRDVCNSISNGDHRVDAFAFVPHSGTVDSTDISVLDNDTISDSRLQELVDVFCVYPETLPKSIDIDDIYAVRADIIRTVYGKTNEDELPETVRELSSSSEAYGDVRIEIYTVSAGGLERVNENH